MFKQVETQLGTRQHLVPNFELYPQAENLASCDLV